MSAEPRANPGGKNVLVEFEDGIAWVTLNRPEKRNAMSPELNREMMVVLDELEVDDRCKVLVLTGRESHFRQAWTSRSISAKSTRRRPSA
jgi:feruloyl-CoA hydratase/lyase